MPVTESSSRRLKLVSGSTTLLLDKDTGKVVLQRKFWLWRLKPVEAQISELKDVKVDAAVDRASGVEMYHTVLVLRSGAGWMFPASDRKDAQENATAIRNFVDLIS